MTGRKEDWERKGEEKEGDARRRVTNAWMDRDEENKRLRRKRRE